MGGVACCRSLVAGSDDPNGTIYSGCLLGRRGTLAAGRSADFGYVAHVEDAGQAWEHYTLPFDLALGVLPLGGGSGGGTSTPFVPI